MLKKYKNALHEEISKSGFDAGKFRLEEEETEGGRGRIRITYKGDETLIFYLDNPKDNFDLFQYAYSTFSPARMMELSPGRRQDQWFDFDRVIGAFRTWLSSEIKSFEDEALVPDLWTQLETAEEFLAPLPFSEHGKQSFTKTQKEQIKKALEDLHSNIVEHFKLSEAESKKVKESLDHCSNALDRLNRFDWRTFLVGTALTIAFDLSLDPTKQKLLSGLFREAFKFFQRLLS